MDKITVFKDYDGTVGIKIPASLVTVVSDAIYDAIRGFEITGNERTVLYALEDGIFELIKND